jgi:crotonobetainyl-CoA:carnitine CoA-transferase CaiB-like acyl-CoA transferase
MTSSQDQRGALLVEVAAVEVVASCLGESFSQATCPRRGDSAPDRADRALSVVACADGYVGVAAPTPDDRALLAGLTGLDALADEAAPLAPLLDPWLRNRTRDDVFKAAQLWRLPVVPALSPAEALRDEQSIARGVWSAEPGRPPRASSPFRFTPSQAAAPRSARPGPRPLSDLRVLDLGQVWSGPYCGRLLAGLGARVVKVEAPHRPDGTRPASRRDCQGVFADLNRGKASLALDLTSPAGRGLLLRLAARTDLLLENFSPRVMPNFGLDYPSLAAVNPALIMLSMPAFGADGPWASYVAYGSGLELATGLAARSADGRPEPTSVAYLDYLAGCYGAVGALAAVLARDRSGRGGHLELAQREVACQVLATERSDPPTRPGLLVDPIQVAADPHLAARRLLAEPPAAGRPCYHYARLPFLLHDLPERGTRAAPTFGQDSRRLLRHDLGLAPDDLAVLVRAGVVGVPVRPEATR